MPANPYDQFDHIPPATTPKKRTEQEVIDELDTSIADPVDDNPYDQFDGHEGERELQPWEILPQWMVNWGDDSANVLKGVGTALAPWNWGQTTKQITDMAGGFPMMALTPEAQEAIVADNPKAAEMRAAAKAVIDQYGENYSNPGKFLFEHPAQFGMDASSLLALGPAAGIRAAAAGRIPERAIDAAAILTNPTRAIEGPAQLAGNAVRAGVNRLNPQRNLLLGAAEGQESEIINALRARQELVPGSHPTSAQVISQMDTPPIQMQKLMDDSRKLRETENKTRMGEQNAARFNAVDAVVPHPDLDAAIADRNAQADLDYAAAGVRRDSNSQAPLNDVMLRADDELLQLMNERPIIASVFERARQSAANAGRAFQEGENTPARLIPGQPTSGRTVAGSTPTLNNHIPGERIDYNQTQPMAGPYLQVPQQYAQYPADSLHRVKLALDEEAYATGQKFGWESQELRDIQAARESLLRWFEHRNPAYTTARENFRDASVPIDQTSLLNYYRAKLGNLVTGEDAEKLNAQAFAAARSNALNEATFNSSIKKSTGQSRYRHEQDILTPEQIAALDSVQADLARAKMADEDMRTPSSHGGQLGRASEGAQAPSFLSLPTTIYNYLARAMEGRVNQGVANRLAEAAPNPEAFADLLEEAVASRARLDRASVPFQRAGQAVQMMNRFPAGYNALDADRKRRLEKENREILNHL